MAETLNLTKEALVALAERRLDNAVGDSGWSARQKLALTCRILFDAGHDSGLAGQITCRAGDVGTYYTQRLSSVSTRSRRRTCCGSTRISTSSTAKAFRIRPTGSIRGSTASART